MTLYIGLLIAGTAAATIPAGWLWWCDRLAARDTVPGWDTDTTLTMWAAEPRPGRHRKEGEPASQASAYRPRRDLAEVPPSILAGIEALDPIGRARELVRQLGQRAYSPVRSGALRCRDHRLAIEMQAATIARRHGRASWLGLGRAIGGVA